VTAVSNGNKESTQPPGEDVENETACAICRSFASKVLIMKRRKLSNRAIEAHLQRACKAADDKEVARQCQLFLDRTFPGMLNHMSNNDFPENVCEDLHFCDTEES
jgi:hypothetical protein